MELQSYLLEKKSTSVAVSVFEELARQVIPEGKKQGKDTLLEKGNAHEDKFQIIY